MALDARAGAWSCFGMNFAPSLSTTASHVASRVVESGGAGSHHNMSAKNSSKSSSKSSNVSSSTVEQITPTTPAVESAKSHDKAVRIAQKAVLAAVSANKGIAEAQAGLIAAQDARAAFATKRLPLACTNFLALGADATDAQRAEAITELRSSLSAMAATTTATTENEVAAA